MKKFFAVILGVFTLSVVCSCSWADVAINATNFPNEVFREYVRQFDGNGNGVLSDKELEACKNEGEEEPTPAPTPEPTPAPEE